MNYAYYEFTTSAGRVIEVTLDKQANVLLLDSANYDNFRRGRNYRYQGGLATQSPCHLTVPHSGHWYVVINLGGAAGTVRHSARVI